MGLTVHQIHIYVKVLIDGKNNTLIYLVNNIYFTEREEVEEIIEGMWKDVQE